MSTYDLTLRSRTSRQKVVHVKLDPVLAWGIIYAFAMLELYLDKYVGMQAHVLRPAASGKRRWHVDEISAGDVRVVLDLPASPNGEHLSLVCMHDLRLFAVVTSANGLRAYATVDASPEKLSRIRHMAALYGPIEQETLLRYCKCVPASTRPSRKRYRMADENWRNPIPRLELPDELSRYVSVRSTLLASGQAGVLANARKVRSLIRNA